MNKILGIISLIFISLSLILSVSSFNLPQPLRSFRSDSLFRKSHDDYYRDFVKDPPFLLNAPNQTYPLTNSVYNNINISQNTYPQNEPSVKISRKNPLIVVAAFRDFRTGVQPALRRIGYTRSTDGGLTWSPSALLPSVDSLRPLASDPAVCTDTAGNFYISTLTLNQPRSDGFVVVYKSTNNGISFDQSYNIAPLPDTISFMEDKDYLTCDLVPGSPYRNNIYVNWAGYTGSCVVRSTNGGLNWSERILLPGSFGGEALEVGVNGVLYIMGKDFDSTFTHMGFYMTKSTNGGLNFTQPVLISNITLGSPVIRLPSVAVDISNGPRRGFVYAVWSSYLDSNEQGDDEDIFFSSSSDEGATWSARKRVNDDAEYNGKKQYFPWVTCSENGNIYIVFFDTRNTSNNYVIEAYLASSTDGGLTFRNDLLSTQPSPVNYPNYDVRYGDYIGIDSWGGRVVPVWTDERAGNFDEEIYTAQVRDSAIGIGPITQEVPESFRLYQNYPNPFNPVTIIRFDVPSVKNSEVILRVFDILGRTVATLVNSRLSPGTYEIKFNASQLSSGIYFYELSAGEFKEIRKMVLIK